MPSAAAPATPARALPGENPLDTALRSVVSITGNVKIDGQNAQILGSGFFVTKTGLILTNAHVMDREGTYLGQDVRRPVPHPGGPRRSRDLDIGLLAAMGEGPFPALAFGHATGLKYGEQVWAIGSPLSPELGFTVTRGVVSSPLRL